jgi:hypothetical protein
VMEMGEEPSSRRGGWAVRRGSSEPV